MKKTLTLALVILAAFLATAACGNKAAAPKAGSATGQEMLSLFPKDTRGVIVVNVHRIMQTEAVTNAIQKGENKAKYDEFVQQSGIDPQKDMYFFAGGVMGDIDQKNPDFAAVLNLKYDKNKLLAIVQKKRGQPTTADYNGVTIYQVPAEGEDKKPGAGAFLDDSNIVVGSEPAVKKVIDVYQKKAENVWKNAQMPDLLKGMNTAAMVWGGMTIPADKMKQAAASNPMFGAFSDIQSLILSFDVKNDNVLVEIKALCSDAAKNKQIADTLNGFKALGAGAAAKEPLVGELLNKIQITSAADNAKISADIPTELIQKLGEKAKASKTENKQ